jgi:hypothetical protein
MAIAQPAFDSAISIAAPEEDPPGIRPLARSYGFRGVRQSFYLLSAFVLDMRLEQKTSVFRFERAVESAGRPAGVRVRRKRNAAVTLFDYAYSQVTGDEIYLFPVIMHVRFPGVHARFETQMSRALAALILFVAKASEDLLLNSVGVSRRCFPPLGQIDCVKLLVFLLYRHIRLSPVVIRQGARFIEMPQAMRLRCLFHFDLNGSATVIEVSAIKVPQYISLPIGTAGIGRRCGSGQQMVGPNPLAVAPRPELKRLHGETPRSFGASSRVGLRVIVTTF